MALAQQQPGPAADVSIEKNVMVAMRDGVKLATDIYFPAQNGARLGGRLPALLNRTPYGKDRTARMGQELARRGYVVLAQDTRGRYASEGRWRMLVDDPQDGYDAVEWIAAEPWSNGKVGMFGGSYEGMVQHAAAEMRPPHLTAILPTYGGANTGIYGMRHMGAFELRFFNWIFALGARESPAALADPNLRKALSEAADNVKSYLLRLPLRPGATPLELAPDYEAWLVEAMSHGDNDAWWRRKGLDVIDFAADYADIPVLHVTGWYDSWTAQVAGQDYVTLAKSKHNQKLLVGPWTHGGNGSSRSGDVDFGKEAVVNGLDLHLRWYDHWLKGVDNGVEQEAPVRIFVMGGGDPARPGVAVRTSQGRLFHGGRWRDETAWPPPSARLTSYYLQADGALDTQAPARRASLSWQFDPAHPVPTIGGGISSATGLMDNGGFDQKCAPQFWGCTDTLPLSARNDVLVFRTAPLAGDVEVTGPIIVKLTVSSSAPDTDFTAKLIDVYPPSADYPAGYALNLSDGIIRARYRNSLEKAELMKPGVVAAVELQLYPTSNLFKSGHRIRLDISSSNFPRFDVNPNTGEPLNNNRRTAIATNTVYLGGVNASQLVLPIVPTR
jgi:hypothetical protein